MKKHDLVVEDLIEALTKTQGFLHAAKRYLKKHKNCDLCYNALKKRVKEWGLEEWLKDMRTSLAEDCLQKAFHKGISEGDNHCIFWVLERYGHHVDFLDSKDTETESKKGWRELLEYVKEAPKPETIRQPAE